MNGLRKVFLSPDTRFFIPLFFMRLTFGLFFFSSGINKVFKAQNHAAMLQTITDAGIPYPAFMAMLVALCEMTFGLLLAAGALTRISALILLIISTVALLLVGIHQIPPHLDIVTWYSWLLYLPESGYILISLLLLIQGSGPFGIDQLIARKLFANRAYR